MADFENGDIIRVAALMEYDGSDDVVNVYHIRFVEGGPSVWATMSVIIQAYMDNIMLTLDTELSTLMVAKELQVSNVSQTTVFGAIDWGDFAQGGGAGEVTAAGVCCFAFARTRKPRVQIRKYYSVFPQGSMVGGLWDQGVLDAVDDAMQYHIAEQTLSSTFHLQGVAWNRDLVTYEEGITVAVRSEPGYQRRRKRGVGS